MPLLLYLPGLPASPASPLLPLSPHPSSGIPTFTNNSTKWGLASPSLRREHSGSPSLPLTNTALPHPVHVLLLYSLVGDLGGMAASGHNHWCFSELRLSLIWSLLFPVLGFRQNSGVTRKSPLAPYVPFYPLCGFVTSPVPPLCSPQRMSPHLPRKNTSRLTY